MLIKLVAASRSVEIEDPGNFRAFAVRIEGPFEDTAARDALLGSLAVSHDREHAWISEAALRAWAPLKDEAWWQEGLSGMIAAVQRFGWVDNDNHTIRAHIEYTP
jgi:hypothetical protein